MFPPEYQSYVVSPGVGIGDKPESFAGHRVRDTVRVPLGRDEPGHGYLLLIASLTQRATLGLSTSHAIASSALPLAQPDQLRVLVLARPAIAVPAPVGVHPNATWLVMIAVVAAAGAVMLYGDIRRRTAGLVAPPLSVTLLKVAAVVVAGLVVAVVANTNRSNGVIPIEGMPWGVLVVLGVLFGWTVLLGRTHFGRYVYGADGADGAEARIGQNGGPRGGVPRSLRQALGD